MKGALIKLTRTRYRFVWRGQMREICLDDWCGRKVNAIIITINAAIISHFHLIIFMVFHFPLGVSFSISLASSSSSSSSLPKQWLFFIKGNRFYYLRMLLRVKSSEIDIEQERGNFLFYSSFFAI